MEHLSIYQTENLMLLMGTNPLPNYISARMLCKPETRLHLVVTPEIQTTSLHERLVNLLNRNPKDESQYLLVESSDPENIFNEISRRVRTTPGNWGLNYTGGKKSMATHAYRAMEMTLAQENRPKGVYSYLDADRLALVLDPIGSKPSQYFDTTLPEPVSLWQLLFLHGKPNETVTKVRWEDGYPAGVFEHRKLGEKIHRFPFHPEACEALRRAWLDEASRQEMKNWYYRLIRFDARRFLEEIYENPPETKSEVCKVARRALITSEAFDPQLEYSKNMARREQERIRREAWSKVRLPTCIGSELGGKTIGELAQAWEQTVGDVALWLDGRWLEHDVLAQILKIASRCGINDYALGLETYIWKHEKPDEFFESDVIVMQGNRLFYLSVTTSDQKSLCKSKLFEAYIRAQHLGGEQAESALVTFYPDAALLERELRDERHARVKVFGCKDLQDTTYFLRQLEEWFRIPS